MLRAGELAQACGASTDTLRHYERVGVLARPRMVRRALALGAAAFAQDSHHQGVDERGDHVMGFSHEKATHHFLLY